MISLSRAPILGIDDKIKEVHRAWEYLHSIIDAIRSDGLLPTSQKNIPKIGIRILIQHFFTKEKVEKGIPFVCGYFMDNANDTSVHAIIDRIHIL